MAGTPHPARNITLIAIVVVTAIVVAVLLGLGTDDSADHTAVTRPPSTTTTTEPPTTAPPEAGPTTTISLPPGDYTAMCVELRGLAATYAANPTVAGFRQLLEALDFEALLTASPDGTRPYVETLRDQRQQALDALATAQTPEDLQTSGLPLTFFDALQHLIAVGLQECGVTSG
ncbi:MAG TPA: hypothetical protein VNS19_20550 [Acidimicrobiales bacterium]|nr:hypothetical protein [Acidimicrobiales bacterium]